jgi:hypothetical protein
MQQNGEEPIQAVEVKDQFGVKHQKYFKTLTLGPSLPQTASTPDQPPADPIANQALVLFFDKEQD